MNTRLPLWVDAAFFGACLIPCAWLLLFVATLVPIAVFDEELFKHLLGPGRRDGTRVPWQSSQLFYLYHISLLTISVAAGITYTWWVYGKMKKLNLAPE